MSQGTIPEALRIANQRHCEGQLAQAEAIYRQILAQAPDHPAALHGLGVLAHQLGRNDAAADLISRAVALIPANPLWQAHLAEVYRQLGRMDDAIAAYRRAVALRPDFVDALHDLGLA